MDETNVLKYMFSIIIHTYTIWSIHCLFQEQIRQGILNYNWVILWTLCELYTNMRTIPMKRKLHQHIFTQYTCYDFCFFVGGFSSSSSFAEGGWVMADIDSRETEADGTPVFVFLALIILCQFSSWMAALAAAAAALAVAACCIAN